MKSRFNKILTIITAVTFVAALAINVQASFNDPFAGMSDEAIVQTTSDTSGETTEINWPPWEWEIYTEDIPICGTFIINGITYYKHEVNCWEGGDDECTEQECM